MLRFSSCLVVCDHEKPGAGENDVYPTQSPLEPEDYLAGVKAPAYRLIESLAEYLMITQDAYRVEQYIRQPDDRWLLTDIGSLETSIELASIHCELAMSDIYDKVRARDGLFHKSPE